MTLNQKGLIQQTFSGVSQASVSLGVSIGSFRDSETGVSAESMEFLCYLTSKVGITRL